MTPPSPAAIRRLLDAAPHETADDATIQAWCAEFDSEVGRRDDEWLKKLGEFMNGKEVEND